MHWMWRMKSYNQNLMQLLKISSVFDWLNEKYGQYRAQTKMSIFDSILDELHGFILDSSNSNENIFTWFNRFRYINGYSLLALNRELRFEFFRMAAIHSDCLKLLAPDCQIKNDKRKKRPTLDENKWETENHD